MLTMRPCDSSSAFQNDDPWSAAGRKLPVAHSEYPNKQIPPAIGSIYQTHARLYWGETPLPGEQLSTDVAPASWPPQE